MPAKKAAKKKAKPAPKKAVKKPAKKTVKKTTQKKTQPEKKGDAFECHICGYRLIVDEVCGCMDEHVFVCCNKVMKKKRAKKKAK